MGASVVVVGTGGETLRDAVNEALRACVADDDGAMYYLASAPTGPHPIPLVVRSFLAVIGEEARRRMLREAERLPEAVVTCIGAGSNATGVFSGFLHDPTVRLVGVEAAGDGLETTRHSATLSRGKRGVFHGGMTYVLQNEDGQIRRSHSIAAGMDYPGVAPELSLWKDRGRIEVTSATDGEALRSFELLSRLEGIIPSLESAHAVHHAVILARSIGDGADVLVCITGNGDKDVSVANSQCWLHSKES